MKMVRAKVKLSWQLWATTFPTWIGSGKSCLPIFSRPRLRWRAKMLS